MRRIILMTVAMAVAAFGADVTGNWKATAEGPNGSMTRTFALKVDGEKLTGETVSSFAGKSPIMKGVIKGDDMTFTIKVNFNGEEMEVNYKGKVVSADEIKFTADVGGNTIEWNAKREK